MYRRKKKRFVILCAYMYNFEFLRTLCNLFRLSFSWCDFGPIQISSFFFFFFSSWGLFLPDCLPLGRFCFRRARRTNAVLLAVRGPGWVEVFMRPCAAAAPRQHRVEIDTRPTMLHCTWRCGELKLQFVPSAVGFKTMYNAGVRARIYII